MIKAPDKNYWSEPGKATQQKLKYFKTVDLWFWNLAERKPGKLIDLSAGRAKFDNGVLASGAQSLKLFKGMEEACHPRSKVLLNEPDRENYELLAKYARELGASYGLSGMDAQDLIGLLQEALEGDEKSLKLFSIDLCHFGMPMEKLKKLMEIKNATARVILQTSQAGWHGTQAQSRGIHAAFSTDPAKLAYALATRHEKSHVVFTKTFLRDANKFCKAIHGARLKGEKGFFYDCFILSNCGLEKKVPILTSSMGSSKGN